MPSTLDNFLPIINSPLAEKIIYSPRSARPRTISAIVERSQPVKYGPGGAPIKNDIAPSIEIWIANDPIKGSPAIDTGGDTFSVARWQGFPPEARMVAEVMGDSTPAVWHVKLR